MCAALFMCLNSPPPPLSLSLSLSPLPPPLPLPLPLQGRSHVFEMPDGTTVGYPGSIGSSHTLSSGSPGPSYGLGMLYMQDGSMSSSQSISSSNSEKQSEDIEDNVEPPDRYMY